MDVAIQLELCLHEQTQIVANATCTEYRFVKYEFFFTTFTLI